MLIPLLIGASVHTLAPGAADTFGSFTAGWLTGPSAILAVFFFCVGSNIRLSATPYILKKGGSLFITKAGVGLVAGYVTALLLGQGMVAGGILSGLSALAVVAAMNDTNAGLYMALMAQYGRKEDVAAYSVMSIEAGPFMSMLTLCCINWAGCSMPVFPWEKMLGAVLPMLLGMALGHVDEDFREFLGRAVPVLIPFFAFALGAQLNLRDVAAASFTGVLMGVSVALLTGVALLMTDRLTGGNGVAGLAAGTTAGNAAAVPAAIASANAAYAGVAPRATAIVASSVIVTAILVPLMTALWAKRVARRAATGD